MLWEEDHRGEVPLLSHDIKDTHTNLTLLLIITFVTWPKVLFWGLFHGQLILFPFLFHTFFCLSGSKGLCGAHTQGMESYILPSKGQRIYINYWDSSVWEICLFSHHLFLFNYLLWSGLMDIYFILSGLVQHYLFCGSNFFRFDHREHFHLVFQSFWYKLIIIHQFTCLEYFITFWNYDILQIIFHISCPIFRISYFFKKCWFLFWKKIY